MLRRNIGAMLAGVALLATPFSGWAADKPKSGPVVEAAKATDPAPASTPTTPIIVQDYDPNPAIWRLADEDTTIYLFGTFHILPPGLVWRTAQFDGIVQEADELVVESSDADLSDETFEAEVARLVVEMGERPPTSQQLSPESAEKWQALAGLMGVPFEAFDKLPPMMAMLTLGVGFAYDAGSTSDAGVESVLESEFAAAGKPILSIEDPLPVFRNMLAIDEGIMIAQLEEDLAGWDGKSLDSMFYMEGPEDAPDGGLFAAEHAWARGDEPSYDMFGDTPFEKALSQVLLTDRNRAWAQWLDERLDRPGVVLVAVGAGHFEGSDSVQNMLAERRLKAVRIN